MSESTSDRPPLDKQSLGNPGESSQPPPSVGACGEEEAFSRSSDCEMAESEEVSSRSWAKDTPAPPPMPVKRGRGRPALYPSHVGQFIGEKLEQRARERVAERLRRDSVFIVDPSRPPRTKRNEWRFKEAEDLAVEYGRQPL